MVVKGAWKRPLTAGGELGSDSWTSNPQYSLTFPAVPDSGLVKLSVTMTQDAEGGDGLAAVIGEFAIHVVRNPKVAADEVMPDAEVVAQCDYDNDSSIVVIEELDANAGPYYLVPSTLEKDEEAPFVISVICETPGADINLTAVVKTSELVLKAIAGDNLDELDHLLTMAKDKGLTRIHATRGLTYLRRRRKELALQAAIDSCDKDGNRFITYDEMVQLDLPLCIAALEAAIDGAPTVGAPPSLIERAEFIRSQLTSIPPMEQSMAAGEWEKLEQAIAAARAAKIDEPTIMPYLTAMRRLRAAARLHACLAKGEDGYTELQSYYNDAIAAELDGDDVAEALRILNALKDAQRYFDGSFEEWMGGSIDNELWVDNPIYTLTIGEQPLKVSLRYHHFV